MPEPDYERTLGVVEALVAVRDQCPNGAVRTCAERALEALREKRTGVLMEQAYFVLTTSRGWRGERADQVRRSLETFLDSTSSKSSKSESDAS